MLALIKYYVIQNYHWFLNYLFKSLCISIYGREIKHCSTSIEENKTQALSDTIFSTEKGDVNSAVEPGLWHQDMVLWSMGQWLRTTS